jgi:hypothetical protein
MPEAKIIGGMNAEQVRNSAFGQYLLCEAQVHEKDLNELIAETGFDPRRDIREVLFASAAERSDRRQPKKGLVLILGNFDVPRILRAAQAKQAGTEKYQGVDVLKNKRGTQWVAFPDSTLAIAGDAANVQAAVGRLSAPAVLDAALAVKINQLSTTQDFWAVSMDPRMNMMRAAPAQNGIVEKVEEISGGVKLGSTVVFSAEAVATTEKDATALADVVRLMANLARLNTSPQNEEFAGLLDSLNVQAEAKVVRASLSVPEEQLERLIEAHKRDARARRHARARRPLRRE